jgi:hypothetical protein
MKKDYYGLALKTFLFFEKVKVTTIAFNEYIHIMK